MKIKKSILILIVLLSLFGSKMVAQNHINGWFRVTLSIPVAEKIKTDLELQHRRQNDFESNNLFDKSLMHTFRVWIYYKQNKDVVYAISPFAYFSNYKIIQKESDAVAKPANEYRFSASIELQHELANKFFVVDRTSLEYRLFEGSVENVIRLRNRLAFRYDFTSKFNISVGNELFINVSGTDAQHIFDHSRLFANFLFKPKPSLKFDLGYIYISRLPKSNIDLIDESNCYLNFTYTFKNKNRH